MRQFLTRLHVASIDELGRCLFCVRAALVSAVVAWAATIALAVFAPSGIATVAAALIAVALTTLWGAHLTAHALRVVQARRVRAVVRAGVRRHAPTRREMVRMFAVAFIGIAVASAFVASTRRALAADEGCPESTPSSCGTKYCCAGPAKYHCSGYTGYAQPWRQMVNFCTNDDSDEAIADLRSNCAELVQC
ncbi:MAG: DUF3624 family protein [Alphaproteobacteria bacterium]|nr:DUF3624 family protein [Alphaproteobacteria bacterium]